MARQPQRHLSVSARAPCGAAPARGEDTEIGLVRGNEKGALGGALRLSQICNDGLSAGRGLEGCHVLLDVTDEDALCGLLRGHGLAHHVGGIGELLVRELSQ